MSIVQAVIQNNIIQYLPWDIKPQEGRLHISLHYGGSTILTTVSTEPTTS